MAGPEDQSQRPEARGERTAEFTRKPLALAEVLQTALVLESCVVLRRSALKWLARAATTGELVRVTGTAADRSIDLDAALVRLGYSAFRPGQREAVETILERRRLLAPL